MGSINGHIRNFMVVSNYSRVLLLFKTIIVTFQHHGGIHSFMYLKRDYFAASTKHNFERREFIDDVLCADFLSIIPQGIVYMELSLVLLPEKL